MQHPACTHPAHSLGCPPAAPAATDATRPWCGLGALAWIFLFGWLWLGAPWLIRGLGLAWFALGLAWPAGFIYSLALAFPWFGNNPGGPHALCLLEMGLMGLVVGHLAARVRGAVAPRPNRLDLWIFLFVAHSWVGLVFCWQAFQAELLFSPRQFLYVIMNRDGTANTFGLQMALKLTLAAGLYVVLRDRPWSTERLRRLWGVLLAGLIFTALVGWLVYAKWLPIQWWREENPFIKARFGWTRLQSFYWHPGWLAQYLEALAPAALALALTARRPAARWAGWGVAAFLLVTQFFTMARAGWIGLAGGYGMVIMAATLADTDRSRLRRLAWRLGLLMVMLGVLAALFALLSDNFRLRLGELYAWRDRFGIWESALQVWRLFPFVGVGLGNYFIVIHDLFPNAQPYWVADNITAHSLYLHLLSERGLIGLGLFLILFGLTLRRLLGGLGRTGGAERGLRLALLGGLVALALDGLFQYTFYVRAIEIIFWLMLAWSTWLGETPRSHGRRAWRIGVCTLALPVILILWFLKGDLFPSVPVFVDGKHFFVAERQVALPLPEGAHRIRLTLANNAPDAEGPPPVETVLLGTRELARVEFKRDGEVRTLELALPADRPQDQPLLIRSSRTWSLWAYGWRQWPYARIGILYQMPERVE